MTEVQVAMLLQLIRRKGDINCLVSTGITFEEIGMTLQKVVTEGFATKRDNELVVEPLGISFIRRHLPRANTLIFPDNRHKIPRIPLFEIFIPSRHHLDLEP